jgi:hypothetical protein
VKASGETVLEIKCAFNSSLEFSFETFFALIIYFAGSRNSSVGIATGYGLNGRGSITGRDFSLLHNVQIGSGATQPPLHGVLGAISPGSKVSGA